MKYYHIKGDFPGISGTARYAQTRELAEEIVKRVVNKYPEAKCEIEELETSSIEALTAVRPFMFLMLY